MIDVLKNASEALIFINTGRGYVQTCQSLHLKIYDVMYYVCGFLNID
jgi:hypothetical protein